MRICVAPLPKPALTSLRSLQRTAANYMESSHDADMSQAVPDDWRKVSQSSMNQLTVLEDGSSAVNNFEELKRKTRRIT